MFRFLFNLFKRKPQPTQAIPVAKQPPASPSKTNITLKPLPNDELLLMDDEDLFAEANINNDDSPLTLEQLQIITQQTANNQGGNNQSIS